MKKMFVLVFFLVACATADYVETLNGYKQHCKNIGFKKGTESFANCVMEQYRIANQ
jgi:hypothetical protein